MIAIIAAGMLAAGVLCGCAPFNGKAGEMLKAVTSVNQNKRAEESGTEQEKGEVEEFATGNADAEDSGGWNGEEELMKRYEERMELTTGRVSAAYRKAVCLNLLGDFLEKLTIKG